MEIIKLSSNIPYASNSYLLVNGVECAIVDPSCDFSDDLLNGKILKYILLTHGHFDHFLNIDPWIQKTGAEVIVSKKDAGSLIDPMTNCAALFLSQDMKFSGNFTTVKEGDLLYLGEEKIEIYEYPGHTPGSLLYLTQSCAFSGDLAFAGGGYGRFDLPGGDSSALLSSLRRLMTLPDDTIIYPGHGEKTTIKDYKNIYRYK